MHALVKVKQESKILSHIKQQNKQVDHSTSPTQHNPMDQKNSTAVDFDGAQIAYSLSLGS